MTGEMIPISDPTAQTRQSEADRLLHSIQRHEMATPVLLFLAGHRPLAFVMGQLLHVAAPMADLLGWTGCDDWATILSEPDGPSTLEQALHNGRKFDN